MKALHSWLTSKPQNQAEDLKLSIKLRQNNQLVLFQGNEIAYVKMLCSSRYQVYDEE